MMILSVARDGRQLNSIMPVWRGEDGRRQIGEADHEFTRLGGTMADLYP